MSWIVCGLISGVLKAIHCGSKAEVNRITKDTVIFHAADFIKLSQLLQLDLHEPPVSQVSWKDFVIKAHNSHN